MTEVNSSPEGVPAPSLKYLMTYQADLLPAQNINRDRVVWDAAPTGGWVKDIWGNRYHSYHKKNGNFCDTCSRMISIRLTGGGFQFNDGRYISVRGKT